MSEIAARVYELVKSPRYFLEYVRSPDLRGYSLIPLGYSCPACTTINFPMPSWKKYSVPLSLYIYLSLSLVATARYRELYVRPLIYLY